jgi:predicted ATP-binding protein involved in virulence
MNLSKATIMNFREIGELVIELDPRINVLVGENCSGKTSVLDAIAIALSTDPDVNICNCDIKEGTAFSHIALFDRSGDVLATKEMTVGDSDGDCVSVICNAPGNRLFKLIEWFYETENTEGSEYKLESVKYALKEFLRGFSDFYTVSDPVRMIAVKNGKRFEMNHLSGGELAIIDLVGSLAMKMTIMYTKPGNALSGAGIVLVDEIDIHLHPIWQRMIVPKLLDIFPYCQFIVSTNSPHVINSVRPESLFILKNDDDGISVMKATNTYGKTADSVLEDIMGLKTTRPDKVAHDLHRIFEMIDDGYLDTAKEHIAYMIDDIGSDPDLTKAKVLIKRYEIIGR